MTKSKARWEYFLGVSCGDLPWCGQKRRVKAVRHCSPNRRNYVVYNPYTIEYSVCDILWLRVRICICACACTQSHRHTHIIKIHDSSHLFRRSELCLNSKRLSGLPYILLTIAARKQIAVLGWKMLAASLISRQGRKWTRIGGSLVQHMLSHAFSIILRILINKFLTSVQRQILRRHWLLAARHLNSRLDPVHSGGTGFESSQQG